VAKELGSQLFFKMRVIRGIFGEKCETGVIGPILVDFWRKVIYYGDFGQKIKFFEYFV